MIAYYLVVPLLYFFSYLPTGVLYRLADVLAFVLRNVIGYRKQVMLTNLRNSFPEKSGQEIQQIMREAYTHLADRVVENIKCLTMHEDELKIRCNIDAPSAQLLNRLYATGKDVVIMLAHTGAWEWGGYVANRTTPYRTYGVVSPLKNKYFNNLMQRTRGKMGMQLISMKETSNYFKTKQEGLTLHVFFSDQSPSNANNAYWTTFMHQDTGFFYGGARYAVKHQAIPVYAYVRQLSRGKYIIQLTAIKEDITPDTNPDEIVQGFANLLEMQLHQNPSDWLWSHKRWKKQRPAGK